MLPRETLGVRVFGGLYEECDRTIDSHIRNLRRKLGPGPDGSEVESFLVTDTRERQLPSAALRDGFVSRAVPMSRRERRFLSYA